MTSVSAATRTAGKGKDTGGKQQPSQAEPSEGSVPSLLSLMKTSLAAAIESGQKVGEGLNTLKGEKPHPEETGKEEELKVEEGNEPQEEAEDPIFAAVREAVLEADSALDKFSLKRRAGVSAADAKKGVTSVLEKLADDVWRAVAESSEKPASAQFTETLSALQAHVDAVNQNVAQVGAMLDAVIQLFQLPVDISREQLSSELQVEAQKLLDAFQRRASTRKSSSSTELRKDIDQLLSDMVAAVQASRWRAGEDSDSLKLKKEVARIRQKVQALCKAMEEADAPATQESGHTTPRHARRGHSLMPEEVELMSERSSFRPPSQSLSGFDTEEIKSEISKQFRQSHETLVTELKEHRVGLTSMGQIQRNLQLKQDTLTSDVAEIKRKLFELLPGSPTTGKQTDYSKAIGKLKALSPDLRAGTDVDFVEKFAALVAKERKEEEDCLAQLRSEGLSIMTLQEAVMELLRMKSENQGLLEDNEDAVLKLIRCQSEFEIETEFLKAQIKRLEEGTSQFPPSDEVDLHEKIRELTIENARLRGECFDASNVEPVPESLEYSKHDELTYLKMQLSQKKQEMRRLVEERKTLDEKCSSLMATPQDLAALSLNQDRTDKLSTDLQKLTSLIQSLEGDQPFFDEPETLAELELKSVRRDTAQHIRVVLNLTGGFEICGTVNYGPDQWALVNVGSGHVWVKSDLERYSVSDEEAIAQFCQATKLLENSPTLPRSVVLALGQLIDLAK